MNSENVFRIMQQVLLRERKIACDKEHFWIACLINDNRYDLTFAGVDVLHLQIKDIQRMQKLQMTKAKKEIARKALEKSATVEFVMETTG